LKQGDALASLLFNFALEYVVRKVQINQDGLKLNGTRWFMFYADHVNKFGENVHTVKKNAEALLVASNDNGIEVNAYKIKYMVMSRDQDAG
jgi:hypothetical protein